MYLYMCTNIYVFFQLPMNNRYDRARLLIDHLLGRSPEEYNTFISCLLDSEQGTVVQKYLTDE